MAPDGRERSIQMPFFSFWFWKDCVHRTWCRDSDHSTLSHRQPCKGEPSPVPGSASNNRSVAVQLSRIDGAPPVVVVARQRPGQAKDVVGSWEFMWGSGRSGCEGRTEYPAASHSGRLGVSERAESHMASICVGSLESYSLMSLQCARP